MPESHSQNGPALARVALGLALLVLVTMAAGCAKGSRMGGEVSSTSLDLDPVRLPGLYDTVVYAHDSGRDTSFFLSSIPVAELLEGEARHGQILHVDLLWVPKAGSTPMDTSATNASIRHVVIADGEVGVYGGAGFARPLGEPGDEFLRISLRDATVRLLESTDGFRDPLSPARMTGVFTARLDPGTVRKVRYGLSQLVTNALGRTRYVRSGGAGDLAAR